MPKMRFISEPNDRSVSVAGSVATVNQFVDARTLIVTTLR